MEQIETQPIAQGQAEAPVSGWRKHFKVGAKYKGLFIAGIVFLVLDLLFIQTQLKTSTGLLGGETGADFGYLINNLIFSPVFLAEFFVALFLILRAPFKKKFFGAFLILILIVIFKMMSDLKPVRYIGEEIYGDYFCQEGYWPCGTKLASDYRSPIPNFNFDAKAQEEYKYLMSYPEKSIQANQNFAGLVQMNPPLSGEELKKYGTKSSEVLAYRAYLILKDKFKNPVKITGYGDTTAPESVGVFSDISLTFDNGLSGRLAYSEILPDRTGHRINLDSKKLLDSYIGKDVSVFLPDLEEIIYGIFSPYSCKSESLDCYLNNIGIFVFDGKDLINNHFAVIDKNSVFGPAEFAHLKYYEERFIGEQMIDEALKNYKYPTSSSSPISQ